MENTYFHSCTFKKLFTKADKKKKKEDESIKKDKRNV